MIPTATLFISSPGDVNEERVIAARVIQRLSEEFCHRVLLDPIFWEHEPMLMTESFQTQIIPPSETDIFIGILWSRMGTRLPANITRADGSRYQSGTEYEFEDAWQGYEQNNKPDILVYRKTAKPLFNPDAVDFEDRVQQKKTLDLFCKRWFQDEEGSFIAAFNPFADLAEFEERLEIHLHKLLNRLYPAKTESPTQRMVTWQQGSPFRGLAVFDAKHAAVFFGRTRAISEIIATLRKAALDGHAFTMVLGTSGSGKSSLVRAGVLPLLTQSGVIEGVGAWQHCIFRPSDGGHELIQQLAQRLLGSEGLNQEAHADADELAVLLEQVGNAPRNYVGRTQNIPYASLCKDLQGFINQRLNFAARQKGFKEGQVHLALVIDQWEEIYTLEYIRPKLRHLFVNIIAALARLDHVWLLATCRSDFYHRCTEQAALVALIREHGQYLLTAPSVSEISQMIHAPAQAAGLFYGQDKISKRRLDDVLLDSMVKHPNNLALLQFTLDALYQRRMADNELSYQIYQDMGGIEGALAQRAEDIYRQLSFAAQSAFAPLMRTLITIEVSDDTPIAGRRMLLGNDKVSSALQEILDAYINARLVVTDRESDGTAVARLAHDALIHHWSRLKNWIEEERHLLRIRVRSKEAARHWVEEGRPQELLLHEGHALSQAEELLYQWSDSIDAYVKSYIQKSLSYVNKQHEQDKQQQQTRLQRSRRLNALLTGLTLMASVGASFGLYSRYLAVDAAAKAEIARVKAENALNLAERNSQSAYRQAKRANKIARIASHERNKALRSQTLHLSALANQETKRGDAVTAALLALRGLPQNTENPERPYLPQSEIQLQQALLQQHEYAVLNGHTAPVLQAVFSPDGRQLVTVADDNQVKIWDSFSGILLHTLTGHTAPIWSVQFNLDGTQILTGSLDKSVIVWDANSGKKRLVFRGHSAGVSQAVYTPDGQRIISADLDGHLYFWDSKSGKSLDDIHSHQDRVTSLSFSADGRYMLSTSRDRSAGIWDLHSNKRLHSLEGHQRDINAGAFSADGRYVVTASDDKSAYIWSRASGKLLHKLTGHIREVQKAKFSPNGQHVITASKDHRIGVWNTQTGERRYWLHGHQHGITDIIFLPQKAQTLLSAARDGSMILWSLEHGEVLQHFAGHESSINAISFSPDGSRFVSSSSDHSARLWQMQPLNVLKQIESTTDLQSLKLSPDGLQIWGSDLLQLSHWQWQAKAGFVRTDKPAKDIENMRLRPDMQQLLCSQTQGLSLWDINKQTWQALPASQQAANFYGFSPDGRYIFAADTEQQYLWGRDGHLIALLDAIKDKKLIGFNFSPDSRFLATAYQTGEIGLWRLPDGFLLKQWQADDEGLEALLFHPKSQQLLSLGKANGARLWRIPDASLNVRYDAAQMQLQTAVFSTDGSLLASAGIDGDIVIWLTHTGMEKARFRGHQQAVAQLQFSPDAKRLLSIAADGLRLWDLESNMTIAEIEQSIYAPERAQISSDMQRVLAFTSPKQAYLWQIFPSTRQLIEQAKQRLPRQLSDQQKQDFFLD